MSAAPWAAHFGLARTPFGKSIPARDLFPRQAHAEAIARISFCVVESALGIVTGDVGAGKTVALRAAVAGLDPTRHQVIYIANPAFGTRGLYVTIVRALGAQPRYLKAELMGQASDLLAAETAERHRRVVVICDESHLLQPDQLEELRLLTNSEMDSASPFAAILAGQPTLNRQLRMGMFAALDQRIATRFVIKPMDLAGGPPLPWTVTTLGSLGTGGTPMVTKYQKFADGYKAEAVKLYRESNQTIAETARNLGLKESTLANWVKKDKDNEAVAVGEAPLTPAERTRIRELEADVRRLNMENAFLKKASAYFASQNL